MFKHYSETFADIQININLTNKIKITLQQLAYAHNLSATLFKKFEVKHFK